jgi:hypothetical protein
MSMVFGGFPPQCLRITDCVCDIGRHCCIFLPDDRGAESTQPPVVCLENRVDDHRISPEPGNNALAMRLWMIAVVHRRKKHL